MSVLNQVNINGTTYNIQGYFFGTCSTAAGTAAKQVTCAEFTSSDLAAGALITVIFENANTKDNPTLSINSTTAKNIFIDGVQITTTQSKTALDGVCLFLYDGTQYNLLNPNCVTQIPDDSNYDRPVLMSWGSDAEANLQVTKSVRKSNGVPFTYNTNTGALKVNSVNLTTHNHTINGSLTGSTLTLTIGNLS